jgi:hypothetical protein
MDALHARAPQHENWPEKQEEHNATSRISAG